MWVIATALKLTTKWQCYDKLLEYYGTRRKRFRNSKYFRLQKLFAGINFRRLPKNSSIFSDKVFTDNSIIINN